MNLPSLKRSLRDFYTEGFGKDLLDTLLHRFKLPSWLITKTPLGHLSLTFLARFLGEDLVLSMARIAGHDSEALPWLTPVQVASRDRWDRSAVFYQIYPRAFADSTGNGTGDLQGIRSRLDYLQALGIDALWLSPIYDSPNDDNGYDVRDYRKILEDFGSMEDFDQLLAACHARGLKLIMDLVINHSSDEHAWYQKALAQEAPYDSFYIFRKGKDGGPPNNWRSFFSGPAWRYEEALDQYALCLFSQKQMDLNWDSPALREAVFADVNFWLDKGVDGFRLDVINYLSKDPDFPDGSPTVQALLGYTGIEHYVYGPQLQEHLQELQRHCFLPHQAFTVGETPGLGSAALERLTKPAHGMLDLAFRFDHLELPGKQRFDDYRYALSFYKRWILERMDEAQKGIPLALFFDNHDHPRMLAKIAPEAGLEPMLSKLLNGLLLTLCGTPFLYQGQELGLGALDFQDIQDFADVESLNRYQERLDEGWTAEAAFNELRAGSRDHARGRFPWEIKPAKCPQDPRLPRPQYPASQSVEAQEKDQDSPLAFSKALLQLRKASPALHAGAFMAHRKWRRSYLAYFRLPPALEMNASSFFIEANLSERPLRRPRPPKGRWDLLLGNEAQPLDKTLGPYALRIHRLSD